jgi:hypothetical protein
MQVTWVVPIGKALPSAGEQVAIGFGSAASAQVGPVVSVAVAVDVNSVIGAGHEITGRVVSTTATTKVFETVAPTASVAVHVTTVDPSWNTVPEGGEQVTVTGATPPLDVAAKFTIADKFPVASAKMLSGTVIVNGGTGISDASAIGENDVTRPQMTWFDASTGRMVTSTGCPPT